MVRAYSRTEIVPKEIDLLDDDLVCEVCIDTASAAFSFELLPVLSSMLFELISVLSSMLFELLSVLSSMLLLSLAISISF